MDGWIQVHNWASSFASMETQKEGTNTHTHTYTLTHTHTHTHTHTLTRTNARTQTPCNPSNTLRTYRCTHYTLNVSGKTKATSRSVFASHTHTYTHAHTHAHTTRTRFPSKLCLHCLPPWSLCLSLSPSSSPFPHNASHSVFLSTGLHAVKYIFQIDHAYHSSFAAGPNPFAKRRPHQYRAMHYQGGAFFFVLLKEQGWRERKRGRERKRERGGILFGLWRITLIKPQEVG